jgi:hypothetical protein
MGDGCCYVTSWPATSSTRSLEWVHKEDRRLSTLLCVYSLSERIYDLFSKQEEREYTLACSRPLITSLIPSPM